MSEQRFVIRAELRTPILIREGELTLDSVLAAVVFARTGDLEQAHNALPLTRSEEVWHASSAFLESPSPYSVMLTAALHATHDLNPAQIAKSRGGNLPRLSEKRRREFGNVQNLVTGYIATAVWWFGQGDIEGVRDLLQDVRHVGKKHTAGYGLLDNVELETASVDGVTDSLGYPMRPVPIDRFFGRQDAVQADSAWRPAYWKIEHRARCFVPTTVLYQRDDLERWL